MVLLTLLLVGYVDGMTMHRQCCFVDSFGQGWVTKHHHAQIFRTGTELHCNRHLLNQISSAWANNVGAKNAISYGVSNNFYQTLGFVSCHSTAGSREWESTHVVRLT